jgi:hypothetical protein
MFNRVKKYILIVVLFFVFVDISLAQESNYSPSKIEFGYGLLTFRELDNTFLYSSNESLGLVYGQYSYSINNKFAVGFLAAYDKSNLATATNDEYYIETTSALIRLDNVLFENHRVKLYAAFGVGLQLINKNTLTGFTKQKVPAYEIIPVGISVGLIKGFSINFEASYGCLVPAKVSISYSF